MKKSKFLIFSRGKGSPMTPPVPMYDSCPLWERREALLGDTWVSIPQAMDHCANDNRGYAYSAL